MVIKPDGETVPGPPFPVPVLNVLGAGDAFMAGFLRGWLRGEEYDSCCRLANANGALVVSRHGCSPAMADSVELEHFLAADGGRVDFPLGVVRNRLGLSDKPLFVGDGHHFPETRRSRSIMQLKDRFSVLNLGFTAIGLTCWRMQCADGVIVFAGFRA